MLNTTSLLRRRIVAAANRMMSTHSHRVPFSFNSPRSPWLMLPPELCEESKGTIFNFWCCAQNRKYLIHNTKMNSRRGVDYKEASGLEVLGSSPGWLACYGSSDDLFILDPVSHDVLDHHLPPWDHCDMALETLVFSDSERKAFVICGPGRSLAFCSTSTRRLRDEWTFFGGRHGEYESMVYSTAHRRLFCITSAFKLEAWDVGHHSPRLDWVAHFDCPDPVKWDWLDVQHLACEEQSGQLFLVVRKVCNIDDSSKEDFTVGFEVYRIDRGGLDLMRYSLEGITFFVGTNQAIAIRDVGAGVEPDSVYFTYDSRLGFNSFVGNFDYRRCSISLVPYPVVNSYHTCPVWFTPHPRHIILP